MKRALLWRSTLALLALLFTGLVQAAPLQAVASFTILADMVRQVGGERVQVTSLIGPGGDPHAYEPTPNDAKALKTADIVFINGLHLEGWMDRLIKASGYPRAPVVLTEGIATRSMEEEGQTIVDPHAWNSAAQAIVYVRNVVKALSAVDPEGASLYRHNGQRYEAELAELDRYAREQIQRIPAERRKILTSHDAFGYFSDAYNVTFLAPLGFSTEAEASAQDMAQLIRQIKAEHIRVYFIENSTDPRLVRQIAQASGAHSGGELYVESLSQEDGPAPTYARLFRFNVDQMVVAMQTL